MYLWLLVHREKDSAYSAGYHLEILLTTAWAAVLQHLCVLAAFNRVAQEQPVLCKASS